MVGWAVHQEHEAAGHMASGDWAAGHMASGDGAADHMASITKK